MPDDEKQAAFEELWSKVESKVKGIIWVENDHGADLTGRIYVPASPTVDGKGQFCDSELSSLVAGSRIQMALCQPGDCSPARSHIHADCQAYDIEVEVGFVLGAGQLMTNPGYRNVPVAFWGAKSALFTFCLL